MNIKDMVANNKKVKFVRYREGEFIYATECGFEFVVPLADLGKATLLAEDKALLFLRYIRKQIDLNSQERKTVALDNFSSVVDSEGAVEGTLDAFKKLIA